jgi:hypothetical protein
MIEFGADNIVGITANAPKDWRREIAEWWIMTTSDRS